MDYHLELAKKSDIPFVNLVNATPYDCSNLSDVNSWTDNDDEPIKHYQIAYYVITSFTSVLSICGSAFILYYYFTIKSLQNKSRQLLVFLTVCDLGIAVGNIYGIIIMLIQNGLKSGDDDTNKLSAHRKNVACQMQAGISSGFSIASFFWTSFIGLNVYMTVNHNSKALIERYRTLLHIASWGVPIVVLSITYGCQRFGYNPCGENIWYCWITPNVGDHNSTIVLWQLFSGKFWEIISYIFVLVFYLSVKFKLKHFIKRTSDSVRSEQLPLVSSRTSEYALADRKLTLIPLVFILTRIWGSLRFLLLLGDTNAGSGTYEVAGVVLSPFQGFGDSAQGFFNCLVFMWTTPCLKDKFPMKYLVKRSDSGMQISEGQVHEGTRAAATIGIGSSSTSTERDTDSDYDRSASTRVHDG